MTLLETHSDLIKFLNRVLPQECENVSCVTTIKCNHMKSMGVKLINSYEVEVLCEKRMDECSQFKLIHTLDSLFRFYGMDNWGIHTKVIYRL